MFRVLFKELFKDFDRCMAVLSTQFAFHDLMHPFLFLSQKTFLYVLEVSIDLHLVLLKFAYLWLSDGNLLAYLIKVPHD